jgi:endonuclease/exonuclease/phosphatase family metal-dependent hydrolase
MRASSRGIGAVGIGPRPKDFATAGLLLALNLAGCTARPATLEDSGQNRTLRVLAYNIRHGEGMDRELNLERAAAVIRAVRPDIVTLQEVDWNVDRTGRVDQAARLGDLTEMEHSFGPFMEYQGGEYGMAALSRWPIIMSVNHKLPPGEEPRSTLAARIRLPGDGGEVVVAGVHLYRTEAERLSQAQEIVDVFEQEPTPVILAGDFNSQPGSRVMDLIALHWTVPDKARPTQTFPANRPEREIDFIGYRPADRFEVLEYRVIDERVASDHRPVLMVLRLR